MPKPHPIELRERVVAHVEEGHTHRGTAAHFKVSVKFVNDMVKLKQETGSLAPKYNPGKTGHGKLAPYKDWLRNRVDEQKDITIRKLCAELNEKFNLNVHHSPVWHVVRSFGLSHKKDYLCEGATAQRREKRPRTLEDKACSVFEPIN